MRKIFGDYLLKFQKQPIKHKNNPDNTKAVIFIDDRTDFWMMPVLKNFAYHLDDSWNFHIICTDRNIDWMRNTLRSEFWKVDVHHINEFLPITDWTLNLKNYIDFYTTPSVLESFKEETLLTAQFDSLLLDKLDSKWLEYDFIGAPCADGTVFNGGCTIRSKKAMLDCLSKIPFDDSPDDVYYSRKLKELGYKVPELETAVQFAVENMIHKDGIPTGFHGTEKYYFPDPAASEMLNRTAPIEVKKPLLFIATPIYKPPAHPKFMESLERCKGDPRFDFVFDYVAGDAHIERARSHILLKYLRYERPWDWLVMIDSDIEFNADILWGLINQEKDCIGAAYTFKAPEGSPKYRQPVIRAKAGEEAEGHLLKIMYLGGGCTIVSDALVKKMCAHYQDLKFLLNPDLLGGGKNVATYGLWNPVLIEQPSWGKDENGNNWMEMLSEDYSFCQRILDMGEDVWLDLSALIAHWDGDQCFQLATTSE
jgi:hypothetical protein